jgi:hypothetical protein
MKKGVSNRLVLICFVSSIATFLSCLREADLPTLTTTEVSNIKTRSASSGGTITDDGGAEINVSGVCWGTDDNPTRANSISVSRKETRSFDCNLFNLIPDTYYHVRAFASNRVGTAYGEEVHFTTKQIVAPKVTTTAKTNPATFTATAGGNITSYDETLILERGVCWATTAYPTKNNYVARCGTGSGIFTCDLTQLQLDSLYYVRAYAETIAGITYGNEMQISTKFLQIITAPVIEFSRTTARVGGKLFLMCDPELLCGVGICYGTKSGPTVKGNSFSFDWGNDGIFSSTLTDLTPGTLYYVRAYFYATGWIDGSHTFIQYGNEITFATSQ